MATIIFYEHGLQDESVTIQTESLATWALENAPKHDCLHVWQGVVSEETELREFPREVMLDPFGVYHISAVPQGPETWIPVLISTVIGVAAAVFLTPDVPVPDPTNQNLSSNNALQQRSNKPRKDKRLPSIRGKEPKAFPDLWMQYTKFFRNEEFEVAYMCLSDGYVIPDEDTIRDGDTLLDDIPGESAEFYAPNTSPMSGDEPFLRIGNVINEPLAAVRQSNEVTGQTLKAPNEGKVESTYSGTTAGVISVPVDDADFTATYEHGDDVILENFYSFELVSDPAGDYYRRYDLSGSYPIDGITENELTLDITGVNGWQFVTSSDFRTEAWQRGSDNDWVFTYETGYTQREWNVVTSPEGQNIVGPFVCSDSKQVWLNLVAQQGLYKKGKKTSYIDVDFTVTFREIGGSGVVAHNITMMPNEKDAVQTTFEFDVPYQKCTVEVLRTTDTDLNFNGSVLDEVKWRDLYLVNDITKTVFGNVTTLLTKVRAVDTALRRKESLVSCAATRQITRPDGTVVVSDEFADVVFDLHTDPTVGRQTAATINYEDLYALQERIVQYWGRGRDVIRVGFTFDDDTYRYADHLKLICNAVNVRPYMVGNVINFFFEGPQEYDTQQYGHRSKDPNALESRTRTMRPRDNFDGVEVTYKNEETGDFETIYIPEDQSATNPDVYEFKGTFIYENALARAYRDFNKLKYQRVTHEFTALDKARFLIQGQRIAVVDNTRYQPNNGYIDTVEGLTYYLSQPTDLTIGTQASIVLSKRDGSLEGVPCTVLSDEKVQLSYPPAEPPYTGYMEDPTEYSLSIDSEAGTMSMLVTEMVPEDIDRVKVVAINYDPRYYQNDK